MVYVVRCILCEQRGVLQLVAPLTRAALSLIHKNEKKKASEDKTVPSHAGPQPPTRHDPGAQTQPHCQ